MKEETKQSVTHIIINVSQITKYFNINQIKLLTLQYLEIDFNLLQKYSDSLDKQNESKNIAEVNFIQDNDDLYDLEKRKKFWKISKDQTLFLKETMYCFIHRWNNFNFNLNIIYLIQY